TPFRAVVVPVAARLTVNRERGDLSPWFKRVPRSRSRLFFLFGSKRTKLPRRTSCQRANCASVQRANGTEAAEFRAMELSLGRAGPLLDERIAGPRGRVDRTISDLLAHSGTSNLSSRDLLFLSGSAIRFLVVKSLR